MADASSEICRKGADIVKLLLGHSAAPRKHIERLTRKDCVQGSQGVMGTKSAFLSFHPRKSESSPADYWTRAYDRRCN